MTAPDSTPSAAPLRTPGHRVIQGLLLVAGALILGLTVGADHISFYWTPLILGLSYLAAAFVDGPRGGYWATALGLTGWGAVVLFINEVDPKDIDTAGAYLAGGGLAALAAAVLRRRGFLVSDIGLAATLLAAGLLLAIAPRAEGTLGDATTYAVALGIIGVLNLAGGAYQLNNGDTPGRATS